MSGTQEPRAISDGGVTRQRRLVGTTLLGLMLVLGGAALWLALSVEHRSLGFLAYRSGAVTNFRRADWPARAAGITVRDVITALDGKPVADGRALARALRERTVGERVEVTARRPDGREHSAFLTVARFSPMDLGFALVLPFSIGLLYLLLGAVLFFARASTEATITALLCCVASAFYMTMFDAHTTYRLDGVWLCYPILGPLSVHLFARFPERRAWVKDAHLVALYLVGAALVASRIAFRGDPAIHDRLALASAVMLGAEFVLDLGLLLFAALHAQSANARNRGRSTLFGLALSCSAAVGWQFAARTGAAMTAEQAMVLSALFPFLIVYAILRRNLFDFDAVVRMGLASAVASAALLAIYFALVALGGQLLMYLVGRSQVTAVAATMGFALLFHPLRRAAQRLLDRTLYGGDLGPELARLSRELQTSASVEEWAETCLANVSRLVEEAPLALFVIDGDGKTLTLVGSRGLPPSVLQGDPTAPRLSIESLPPRSAPAHASELPSPLGAQLAELGLGWMLPLERGGRWLGLVATGPAPRYATRRILTELLPPLSLALDSLLLARERAARERLAVLGEMAALIVHEVKNPLGIMRVAAKTLDRRVADRDPAAVELCNCIKDEVDRVDATVHRLLDLARPTEPAASPVDLVRLLEQTSARLRPEFEAEGVSIAVETEDLPTVRGDAEALRRALVNLLHNARQAMPAGGAVRLVGTLRQGLVEVAVEDNGPGVAPDLRPLLFRPFSSRRQGGTGLGLAIVKRTLEEHQGSVRFEEPAQGGARFVLSLPATGTSAAPAAS